MFRFVKELEFPLEIGNVDINDEHRPEKADNKEFVCGCIFIWHTGVLYCYEIEFFKTFQYK
jgi:hypothetical protein